MIKTWGQKLLFNLREDPEERHDISEKSPDIVEKLRVRAVEHFYNLQATFAPADDPNGDPLKWGGYYGPGWCDVHTIQE